MDKIDRTFVFHLVVTAPVVFAYVVISSTLEGLHLNNLYLFAAIVGGLTGLYFGALCSLLDMDPWVYVGVTRLGVEKQ
jgi:hypothetical protein